ncbi:Uncharacterised protein [Vibrio cholerae]|uniref:Uncharacterized protein n=1 Tax=Vibrio cholerae TaxID=666 RepID=A0A655PWF6_VIBCL|nr:Uncharacterised protein [Vibrio cholerae]CSA30683.1 Uncharacterised protein [Vibrio cholerae]CSB23371.1 Uncharacterised protein [Vibrio cholerae]CSB34105.1 Uncharacterised protein [Vibrio cholerae]CSB44316.1 Uncharacterised protein [Vibrio cholerae]
MTAPITMAISTFIISSSESFAISANASSACISVTNAQRNPNASSGVYADSNCTLACVLSIINPLSPLKALSTACELTLSKPIADCLLRI